MKTPVFKEALTEELVRWQIAREQRATARANVRAGNYTNGETLTAADRRLYDALTKTAMVIIVCMAVLVGALIALAVVGK